MWYFIINNRAVNTERRRTMKREIRQKLYSFYEEYDPFGFSDYASEYDNPMEAISEMDPETIIDWLTDIVEEDDDFAEEARNLINTMMAA